VGAGFHPELTGKENVYLNGSILGMKRAEIARKFDEIVAFSEIEQFISTPVKRYSTGMRARLAFAVAAHLEPEILVLDEALATGDVAFREKCVQKMREVASEGRTVVIVSHMLPILPKITDRCIWLHQGKVMDDGDSQTVIRNYLQAVDTHRQA
jgi:lipopolysaccharide transport system ATP-binding protein